MELLALEWAICCKIYSPRNFASDKTFAAVRLRVARSMRMSMGHRRYVATLDWLNATKNIDSRSERR